MNRFSKRVSRLSLLVSAVLGAPACAEGTTEQPQREPVAAPSSTSDGDPFNVTPPGTSGASSGSASSKAGASSSLGGNAGSAPSATGGSAGLGAGTSGAPAAGGSRAAADGGSSTAGAGGTADCGSPTRARLANGQCVDRISEFAIATQPMSITLGSDARIWFDDGSGNRLVQLDDDGRVAREFAFNASSVERELIAGTGDTIVWYTDATAQTVSKLSSLTNVTSYALGLSIAGLGLARDGQLWLTEAEQAVYRFDSSALSLARWPAAPSNTIIVAPDQSAWFPNSAALSRLNTAGDENDFSITDGTASDLCLGPDGALWFTQSTLNQIGRMTLDGTLTRTYDLPVGSQPFRIVAGPDGALWFTEKGADKIGRISVDGVLTHYPTPTSNAVPYGLALGADHEIWFTERNSGKVGRLTPDAVE